MTPNPQEVIARALCTIGGIEPDEDTLFALRAQALAIHTALANAGFEIIERDENPLP